jgi:uncharacterized iron-regulated protein
LIADKDWYLARKEMLEQVKEQVSLRLGEDDPSLVPYFKSYQKEFKGSWRSSSYKELFFELSQAKVVLGADFHAHSQSQRVHLRLLREFSKEKNWALALECFEAKDQKWVDLLVEKKIKEKEFLRKIQWEKRWGFPWAHYRPLIKLAIQKKIPIIAMNKHFKSRTLESLNKRDAFAAKIIEKTLTKQKVDLVYVIYGDLHLSREHLPEKLKSLLNLKKKDMITIFQNSEKLYFQLARQGQEHQIEVLKGAHDRYCIIGTPPWVKWQNYLVFLDKNIEFDSEESEDMDYTDSVKNQIVFILKELKIKLSLNDLEVYSLKDENFWRSLNKKLRPEDKKRLNFFIKNSRSFYLSEQNVFCLAQLTMNHISEVAGHYIQAKLSGRQNNVWKMPGEFTQVIWLEAIGFFMSKLVNHKRKSETLKSLKARLSVSQPKDQGREALLLALDQRLCEILSFQGHVSFSRKFNPKRNDVYFETGRILGHMLGDKIFMAYRVGRMKRKDLLHILKFDISSAEFPDEYARVVALVENMDSPLSLGGMIYG